MNSTIYKDTKFTPDARSSYGFEKATADFAAHIEALPMKFMDLLYVWQQRIVDRRRLEKMDDRILADIGLDWCTAQREAAKPFWKA